MKIKFSFGKVPNEKYTKPKITIDNTNNMIPTLYFLIPKISLFTNLCGNNTSTSAIESNRAEEQTMTDVNPFGML